MLLPLLGRVGGRDAGDERLVVQVHLVTVDLVVVKVLNLGKTFEITFKYPLT